MIAHLSAKTKDNLKLAFDLYQILTTKMPRNSLDNSVLATIKQCRQFGVTVFTISNRSAQSVVETLESLDSDWHSYIDYVLVDSRMPLW